MNGRTCWTIAGLAAGVALGQLTAMACTGMYAGRKVTTDGSTLIARTVDTRPTDGVAYLRRVERGEKDGNVYSYVSTPKITSLRLGDFASAVVNERGLCISATVTVFSRDEVKKADPFVSKADGGVGESCMPGLIGGRCATAAEAVEYLIETIEKRGSDSSDIYMFADADEGWLVEVFSGHCWAAFRLPDDKVAAFGNELMVEELDLNEKKTSRYSPRLVEMARKGGYLKFKNGSDHVVDLIATFSAPYKDSAHYRTYFGHRMLAPSTAGEYDPKKTYPLFFDPEPGTKVSVTNLIALMRTRYEGVNCPEENRDCSVRAIGTTAQLSCHVVQLRHDLPEKYRGTIWACPTKSMFAPFMPLNASISGIDEAFARDQVDLPYRYDPEIAGMAFLRLNTLARMRESCFTNRTDVVDLRPYYSAGIRRHWQGRESQWLEEWPALLTAAARRDDPSALTAYSLKCQRDSLSEAKQMFDELMWYACHNVRISGDGGGATDVPKEPYVPFRRRQADWKAGVVVP